MKRKQSKRRQSIGWALNVICGALKALSEEDRRRLEAAMAIIWQPVRLG